MADSGFSRRESEGGECGIADESVREEVGEIERSMSEGGGGEREIARERESVRVWVWGSPVWG